jgi:hypothetical protein
VRVWLRHFIQYIPFQFRPAVMAGLQGNESGAENQSPPLRLTRGSGPLRKRLDHLGDENLVMWWGGLLIDACSHPGSPSKRGASKPNFHPSEFLARSGFLGPPGGNGVWAQFLESFQRVPSRQNSGPPPINSAARHTTGGTLLRQLMLHGAKGGHASGATKKSVGNQAYPLVYRGSHQ